MTAAEKEALRKILVSGVSRTAIGPDSVSVEYVAGSELERRLDAADAADAATAGTVPVTRINIAIGGCA